MVPNLSDTFRNNRGIFQLEYSLLRLQHFILAKVILHLEMNETCSKPDAASAR